MLTSMTHSSLSRVTSRYVQHGTDIQIQLKDTSFTQTSPPAGLNMQRCRKLDPVCFVRCGTRLPWASPPAVKYTSAKQPVRFHTSQNAAQVTRKHLANTCGLATEL